MPLTLLLDVWGVLHDGREPYPDAQGFLDRRVAEGTSVRLVSNATWPASLLAADLKARGFRLTGVHSIWTAGEAARRQLTDLDPATVAYEGHDVGRWLIEGFDEASIDTAECLVFTEPSPGSRERLRRARERGVLVLCANPDAFIEDRHGHRTEKAGALAYEHRDRGGRLACAGKPEPEIFALAGATPDSILLGDNPATDLAGAARAGCRSVWLRRRPEPDDGEVVRRHGVERVLANLDEWV